MNNFVIDTPDNFWQIRWLDKYMGARRVVRGLLQWPHGHRQQAHRRHGSDGN